MVEIELIKAVQNFGVGIVMTGLVGYAFLLQIKNANKGQNEQLNNIIIGQQKQMESVVAGFTKQMEILIANYNQERDRWYEQMKDKSLAHLQSIERIETKYQSMVENFLKDNIATLNDIRVYFLQLTHTHKQKNS